jgi:hypothetical protein
MSSSSIYQLITFTATISIIIVIAIFVLLLFMQYPGIVRQRFNIWADPYLVSEGVIFRTNGGKNIGIPAVYGLVRQAEKQDFGRLESGQHKPYKQTSEVCQVLVSPDPAAGSNVVPAAREVA